MTIRVVIADDEAVARARLRRLLAGEPEMRIVAECADGPAAVAAIEEHEPDLLFLDIQMPGLDGFGVLGAVRTAPLPVTVFVTAWDEHALRAFEVNATDYLLKPVDEERLAESVRRARLRIARTDSADDRVLALIRDLGGRPGPADAAGPAGYAERLLIRGRSRLYPVRTCDVDYAESSANYVRLHTGAQEHMLREPIGELARRLDPRRFVRIHRTTIVNVERVAEVQPWFSGDAIAILASGKKLRVSRAHRLALERALASG
jgi:two-component system LytT family response regulator